MIKSYNNDSPSEKVFSCVSGLFIIALLKQHQAFRKKKTSQKPTIKFMLIKKNKKKDNNTTKTNLLQNSC